MYSTENVNAAAHHQCFISTINISRDVRETSVILAQKTNKPADSSNVRKRKLIPFPEVHDKSLTSLTKPSTMWKYRNCNKLSTSKIS